MLLEQAKERTLDPKPIKLAMTGLQEKRYVSHYPKCLRNVFTIIK